MNDKKGLGNLSFKKGSYETAIEYYTEALVDNPDDHTVYGNRSQAYANLGQHEKALEDAEACIRIKPDWGKGYYKKGAALLKLGRVDEFEET